MEAKGCQHLLARGDRGWGGGLTGDKGEAKDVLRFARYGEPVERFRPAEIGLDLLDRQKSGPMRETHRRINRKGRVGPESLNHILARQGALARRDCLALGSSEERLAPFGARPGRQPR